MKRKAFFAAAILAILSLCAAASTLARWTRDTYTSHCYLGIGPNQPVLIDGKLFKTDAHGSIDVVCFPFMTRTLRYTDGSGVQRVEPLRR